MNQLQFEKIYGADWQDFENRLLLLERSAKKSRNNKKLNDFPKCYRRLCNHYGLALTRHYSPALVDRLHDLVLRGHQQLYKKKSHILWSIIEFLFSDFPRTLRRHWLAFWVSFLLFYGSAFTMGTAVYQNPLMIYSIMPEAQVAQMQSMYDGKGRLGREEKRDAEDDLIMFGFYIRNNISIGFRTFAGGMVFGVGSVLILLFNGLFIGGAAGHLSHLPYRDNFWQFVIGHGAFELTAIVISGAAGLLLGIHLIRPGRYRRLEALQKAAPTALRLAMGAAVMLLLAAFIEAFWSSSPLSPSIKYWTGALNWGIVLLYFMLAGRRRDEPR